MQGWSDYYRLRIGDYRLGLKLEEETVIVLCFLHQRDIYRRFR
ncbi:MAG: type II toxin-antitoxin system RelE/ParE family toxin [Bacteroidota bacterium]